MRFSFTTYDFVYKYFDLALVSQLAKFLAQEPVLGLSLCSVEVLGCTSKNTLINSRFFFGCDANVV
jgi:hypothetical protein